MLARFARHNSTDRRGTAAFEPDWGAPLSDPELAHFAKLKLLLHRDGVRSALAYLNSLSPYRFTALFRLDPARSHALWFFDRRCPWNDSTPDIALTATYCVLVLEHRKPLVIADALAEPWLEAHAARTDVRSYCGVPFAPAGGVTIGTLCHYDPLPHPHSEETLGLLLAFGALLALRPELAGAADLCASLRR
jgi:GAF domain-containing protein